MKRTRGVANVAGRVAYVAQQAWIQNNTLSDNITFGKRFNAELYHKVAIISIFLNTVCRIWGTFFVGNVRFHPENVL